MNNIIKSVEKAGKGYSFDVLRAKVLYGTHATLKKPKYTEDIEFQRFEKLWGGKFDNQPIRISPPDPDEYDIVGVDLTTLSKILEDGDF